MYFSNANLVLAVVAVSSFWGAHADEVEPTCATGLPFCPQTRECSEICEGPFKYGGYTADTLFEIEETLKKEDIQNAFKSTLGDSTCAEMKTTLDYYENGDGQFYKNIPTYKDVKSQVWEDAASTFGADNYYDKIVMAALKGKKVTLKGDDFTTKLDFTNKKGFTGIGADDNDDLLPGRCVGRKEVANKGIAFISGFLEVAQYLEGAVQNIDDTDKSCNMVDKAAAFYVGWSEGLTGLSPMGTVCSGGKSPGGMLFGLGNKRAGNYRTYGQLGPFHGGVGGGADQGQQAAVNTKVIGLFTEMSAAMMEGDADTGRKLIRKINSAMTVPLIQGALRYASKIGQRGSTKDKEVGEGVVFALAALPQLAKCSKNAAKDVLKNVSPGKTIQQGKANWKKVYLPFFCNFKCMGITSAEVSSLWDGADCKGEGKSELFVAPIADISPRIWFDECDATKKELKKLCSKY